ncbi:MAG: hypothetical protein U0165_19180 [Polyangiaceae bacterium]
MSTEPHGALSEPFFRIEIEQFPSEVTLVPDELSARVFLHDLTVHEGKARCWTIVTHGLVAHQQREVAMTLKIPAGADPCLVPTEPLRFAISLLQLASQGRTVDHGGYSELRGAGFLNGPGVLYVNAPTLAGSGVELPPATLLALRLTAAELEVLKELGATRVLAAWGKKFRHYPFPPWNDPARPDQTSMAEFNGTILQGVPHLQARGWSRLVGNTVTLEMTSQMASVFAQSLSTLPKNAGFALHTHIDPTCDACLVWTAGQTDPSAITPPGSTGQRICGAFVLFIPQQAANAARLHEDGFAILLTDSSTEELRQSLETGRNFRFLVCTLKWRAVIRADLGSIELQNPADGKTYEATDGFRQYQPQEPKQEAADKLVKTKEVVLLTSEAGYQTRVTVDELSGYVVQLIEAANICLAEEAKTPGWQMLVDITLAPSQPGLCKIMTRGRDIDGFVGSALHARIAKLTPPEVTGDVHFQVFFERSKLGSKAKRQRTPFYEFQRRLSGCREARQRRQAAGKRTTHGLRRPRPQEQAVMAPSPWRQRISPRDGHAG